MVDVTLEVVLVVPESINLASVQSLSILIPSLILHTAKNY